MNKRQQEDGYGEVKIPIAILKYIDDQQVEQAEVFCSKSKALRAWKSFQETESTAIL